MRNLARCLGMFVAVVCLVVGLAGPSHAGAVDARSGYSATGDPIGVQGDWYGQVTTQGAWVWVQNGHGHWYQAYQKNKYDPVQGPCWGLDNRGGTWGYVWRWVYLGGGGLGQMHHSNVAGGCA